MTPVRSRLGGLLFVALLLCLSCKGDHPEKDGVGQEFALAEILSGDPPTSMASLPILRIGGIDGPEETQFSLQLDATRLSDGRIVLADGGARQLRFFSEDGQFLRAVGRQGEGPGEFISLGEVTSTPGDTILAGDWRQRSRFDPEGRFLDRVVADIASLQRHLPEGWVRGEIEFIPTGEVLLTSTPGWMPGDDIRPVESAQDSGGVVRYREGYHLTTLDLQYWTDLGEGLGIENLSPDRLREARGPGLVPFMARDLVAAAPDGSFFAFSDSRSGEIRVVDRSGTSLNRFRSHLNRRPMSGADLGSWAEWIAQGFPRHSLEDIRSDWRGLDMPRQMPAFEDVTVDSEGFIWVQEYRFPREGPVRFEVHSASGVRVGEFIVREWVRPLEVGREHVLGVTFDSFGVPTIVLFEVSR